MQRYQIEARTFEEDHPELQAALADAHKRRIRPKCLCSSPAPDMYIAQVDDAYLVKRMPNSAARHHPDCNSFEPPPELSGLGEVAGHAIRPDP
ncbi:DUF1173 domain-containing protein, partial [Thioclava sp. BHET1]